MSDEQVVYMDSDFNEYVIDNGYVYAIGGNPYYNPVPWGFDLTWIMDASQIPDPAPIPYTGEPFNPEGWNSGTGSGDNNDDDDDPFNPDPDPPNPITPIEDLVWVTDRSQADIDAILLHDNSWTEENMNKATLTYDVVSRWASNAISVKNALNAAGLRCDATWETPTQNAKMWVQYPDKPLVMPPGVSVPMGNTNCVYTLIRAFRSFIDVANIVYDRDKLPVDAEFLTYQQINALEEAMSKICTYIADMRNTKVTHYSGQLISGGALNV